MRPRLTSFVQASLSTEFYCKQDSHIRKTIRNLFQDGTTSPRLVVSKVKQLDAVKSVNACWGRPDVFALVEVKNQIELADAVLAKIQQIEGVESTNTHIVIE